MDKTRTTFGREFGSLKKNNTKKEEIRKLIKKELKRFTGKRVRLPDGVGAIKYSAYPSGKTLGYFEGMYEDLFVG